MARHEQELRHRSQQLERLIYCAPLGVYLVDADFRITQVTPVALPFFVSIPGSIIGRDFEEIAHLLWEENYAEETVRIFRHTLETGQPYFAPERAEYRIDLATSWNPRAEALFGYSASEMIGRSIRQIIPPECAPEEDLILLRLRGGQAVHRETVRVKKNGQRVPVSITCSPVKDAAGNVIGGAKIARDISAQKEIEGKLRDAQRKLLLHAADLEATVAERTAKLQETVNDLQSFSYSIAHDMRAPLRAMGTFARLLMDEIPAASVSPEAKTYFERIVIGAARLDNLINDALNYTKAALQESPVQEVDLSKLVRGLLDTYPNLYAEQADILIEEALPVVLGNEALLTQCFSNLLGNAVKFVAPGVRPKVHMRSEINDGFARIWVEDNGIGIPKHAHPRLFAMFQKLDNQYEGAGIGLAIVRKVVERMGGKVGVESEPDRGSRFWVELRGLPKKEHL